MVLRLLRRFHFSLFISLLLLLLLLSLLHPLFQPASFPPWSVASCLGPTLLLQLTRANFLPLFQPMLLLYARRPLSAARAPPRITRNARDRAVRARRGERMFMH